MALPRHKLLRIHLQPHLNLRTIPIQMRPQLRAPPNPAPQIPPTAPSMIPHRPIIINILARERQTQRSVRDFGAGAMAEAGGEPDVLGVGVGDADLVAEDGDDGGDAAEGEAAVAAVAGGGGPGGADPVVVEPGVDCVDAVGAEDACVMEMDQYCAKGK